MCTENNSSTGTIPGAQSPLERSRAVPGNPERMRALRHPQDPDLGAGQNP